MRKFVAGFIILLVASIFLLGRGYSANDWTTNPYVIDATEDSTHGGQIQMLEYHPDASGDVLDVQGESGNQLWYIQAGSMADASADDSTTILKQEFNPPRPTYDIDIKRIGDATSGCSGTLYIHRYKTRQ